MQKITNFSRIDYSSWGRRRRKQGAGIAASGGDRDEPGDVTVDCNCNEVYERDVNHGDKVGTDNVVFTVREAAKNI